MTRRFGITVPFQGATLAEHKAWYEALVGAGYTDVWSAEVDGADGFTPLALAAAWVPTLKLGVAVVPAFTRGPALLAQSVASMEEAAPGRFTFGLGTSSEAIVRGWNSVDFEKPYARVRDVLRFLRSALAGEKVSRDYETFSVRGFRLSRPVTSPPPIYLAALRPQMLRLAGREADGVILNWLAADDVPKALAEYRAGHQSRSLDAAAEPLESGARDGDVVARIFVVPEPDQEQARAIGRRLIAAYLSVPAYAAFHRWLGRAELLEKMWSSVAERDRQGALDAIPDEVVDALVVHGDTDACRAHVSRYVEAGVDLPVLVVITAGGALRDSVLALGPEG